MISNKFFRFLTFIALSTQLSACETLPDWFGGAEETPLKGDRIAVLQNSTSLAADPSMAERVIAIPAPVRNANWEQVSDRNNPNYQNLSLPEKLTHSQERSIGEGAIGTGTGLIAGPIVVDGKVFTVDAEGVLSSYKADDIDHRYWSFGTGIADAPRIGGGIAYADGTVFVASGLGAVVAVNAETGQKLWKRTLNSVARSAPSVWKNMLFVLTGDNRLYALNTKDGAIMWTHSGVSENMGTLGSSSPSVYSGIVIAPYSSGEIHGLRIGSGVEVWQDSLAFSRADVFSLDLPDIDFFPLVARGMVFTSSRNGLLSANDILYGLRAWDRDFALASTPWAAGDFLYVITESNELAALFMGDGKAKWVAKLPQYENPKNKKNRISWSGPVMAGNFLRVVGSHGVMLTLSPNDGSVVDSNEIPEGVYNPPVVANDRLYMVSNSGELVALY